MKKLYLLLVFALCVLDGVCIANTKGTEETKNSPGELSSPNKAVVFEENKGQVKDQNLRQRTDVLFSGSNQGMVFHIRKDGISYQLISRNDSKKKNEDRKARSEVTPDPYSI